MDPLSEVFSTMHIIAPESARIEASAPWGWHSSDEAENRVTFVLVEQGSARMTARGAEPVLLAPGDIFVLFDDVPYTLADDQASPLVDCQVVAQARVGNLIRFGGGGAPTTFVSGSFVLDPADVQPVLAALPGFLHLRLEETRSRAFHAILELLSLELAQPRLASEAAIARLYEVLLVYVVRAYAANETLPKRGWLAAISDRQLGQATRAMHAEMERPWTLQTLAERAAMSRSAYAARFKAAVGQTPLEYLTHWRMRRAQLLMRSGSRSLMQIAEAVGYDSESAFSRVFKRATGMTPGAFRRGLAA